MSSSISLKAPPQHPVHDEGRKRGRPPAFAAIDLGTNNCRMLVGVPAAEGLNVLDSFSRVVRLGEGLYQTGTLSDAAMDRAINALAVCKNRLKRWNLEGVRAIATEACRQAENGEAFIARIRSELDMPIETILPREEAELAVESCASLIRLSGRRALLFDIGGGSTEIGWVRIPHDGGMPSLSAYLSIPVGVVTLTERCNGRCFSTEGFADVVAEVTSLLQPFEAVHRIRQEIRQGGVRLVGTSGTVTTLAGVALKLERYRRGLVDGAILTREMVEAGMESIHAMGHNGLASHPCIGGDRVDFVMPGLAIFSAISELWPAPELAVADRGLREGMLLRMIRQYRARTGWRARSLNG
jgi:exopolyphosphatase/guanosine-5'-triphosphate,3'-diphosphate pyrophosphatase